jgi:hypothetical protein
MDSAEIAPGCAFNPKYLALINSLPNCRISHPAIANEASYFVFDGGEGLIMPLRGPENALKLYGEPAQAEAA